MKKIVLDFNVPKTQQQTQKYLALKFDFPEYYGENLDALYDMLTSITEDTCVGIFEPESGRESRYIEQVKRVFRDAEEVNPRLCVFFADLEEN